MNEVKFQLSMKISVFFPSTSIMLIELKCIHELIALQNMRVFGISAELHFAVNILS